MSGEDSRQEAFKKFFVQEPIQFEILHLKVLGIDQQQLVYRVGVTTEVDNHYIHFFTFAIAQYTYLDRDTDRYAITARYFGVPSTSIAS